MPMKTSWDQAVKRWEDFLVKRGWRAPDAYEMAKRIVAKRQRGKIRPPASA